MATQIGGGGGRGARPWARAAVLALGAGGLLVAAGSGGQHPAPAHTLATATVLVSSRALAEGIPLTWADVRPVRLSASAVAATMLSEPGAAVGRRLRLSVAAGTPLLAALLADPASLAPTPRLVPLTVAADRLAPHLVVGAEVDLVAAEPAAETAGGGRVELVGRGRLVSLDSHPSSVGTGPGGLDVTVVLACDEPTAMHLLWAQSFARSLTVVSRPEGARPLPAVGGAAP
ncbi:MAG: SAF domain-containing protein [Candidatus Dormibacteria bacterium]